MDENVALFSELVYKNSITNVSESAFVEIDTDTRIYYWPTMYDKAKNEPRTGFDFYVAHFHSSECREEELKSPFDHPTFRASCLFHGVVMFDGLRHLYMGDEATDNEDYLYYADTERLAKVFIALRELEKRHCNMDLVE